MTCVACFFSFLNHKSSVNPDLRITQVFIICGNIKKHIGKILLTKQNECMFIRDNIQQAISRDIQVSCTSIHIITGMTEKCNDSNNNTSARSETQVAWNLR